MWRANTDDVGLVGLLDGDVNKLINSRLIHAATTMERRSLAAAQGGYARPDGTGMLLGMLVSDGMKLGCINGSDVHVGMVGRRGKCGAVVMFMLGGCRESFL